MSRQDKLKSFMASARGPAHGGDESLEGMFPGDELEQLVQSSPFARSQEERERVVDAHRKLAKNERLSPQEMGLYEAIVVPTERPPVFVQNDTFAQPPEPWGVLGQAPFRPAIERAIQAVGRVELTGPTAIPYAGTAFVVGPGLLMTNRHVARIFSRGTSRVNRFIDGFGSAIDFLRERDRREKRSHAVARVRLVHPYWDMALLEVEGLAVPHLELDPVHRDDSRGKRVVVVGYPFEDERTPLDLQYRVFDATFGVKRMQPGFAMGMKQHISRGRVVDALAHDSSTLGGNSGSAVVDPGSGRVIGLHFAGEYLVANYAVPAFELSRDALVRDAGVRFASGAPEPANPWQSHWDSSEAVPDPAPARVAGPSAHLSAGAATGAPGTTFTIPIEITIQVGAASTSS